MGLLGDAINDIVTVVGNVPSVVNNTLHLNVTGVVKDVGNVADDTVDTVKHVVENLLGGGNDDSDGEDDDVPPTAVPAPTSSKPTDPPNAPTVTNSSTNGNSPPSNPTSVSSTASPPANPGGEETSPPSSPTSIGGEENPTTVGGTPSATGTNVQPNPVALPHDPSGNDSGDSPSDSSSGSGTNTGTGAGANGGNAPGGGTLPDGGGDKKLAPGAIAGIAIVSAFAGLAVVMCLVRFYFVRRRRGKRHEWAHRSTMMVQAHVNAVTTPAPRLSSDVESGRAPRESYHSDSSAGHRAPAARESYHSDDGPVTVESYQSGAVSVGTTNESNLFTGPPPMPSWSRASRTQQRRILQDSENSSAENENFGTIIPNSRIAWTAPRDPPPVLEEPHPAAAADGVYQTRHANTHLMDDAISLSESSSGCITVESGSSFAAGSSMSQAASTDSADVHESGLLYARSPSPQELPARGSTHLSGELTPPWMGGSSPASSPTPTSTTFSIGSSTTPLMSQLSYRPAMLPAPMAVPLHMIVPSQSPPPPPLGVPLPVPPHMIVPSQSPPPQEPRTLSVMFAQADPFASPHDKPHRV